MCHHRGHERLRELGWEEVVERELGTEEAEDEEPVSEESDLEESEKEPTPRVPPADDD